MVTIRLPGMLASHAANSREHQVAAATAEESVVLLIEAFPDLEVHLRGKDGALRRHLQLFVNSRNVEWFDTRPVGVGESDTVEIVQAVSGG